MYTVLHFFAINVLLDISCLLLGIIYQKEQTGKTKIFIFKRIFEIIYENFSTNIISKFQLINISLKLILQ